MTTSLPDMSDLHICLFRPFRPASEAKLKALGQALFKWCQSMAKNRGAIAYIDHQSLFDLMNGDLPTPFDLRSTASIARILGRPLSDMERKHSREFSREWFKDENARQVYIQVNKSSVLTRRALIESMQEFITAELVEDILVGGRSWTILD